jgi:hypothetical protein
MRERKEEKVQMSLDEKKSGKNLKIIIGKLLAIIWVRDDRKIM